MIGNRSLNTLKIIAFTHHHLPVGEIGNLHIDPDHQKERLHHLKSTLEIDEIMFLSTCNRVEFVLNYAGQVTDDFLFSFFKTLYPHQNEEFWQKYMLAASFHEGEEAVRHLFSVASSIDSMVVGEREIITQVRTAFESCREMGLTGDVIRLLIRQTIETAKKVYTETNIAKNPVSVVSLAYHALKSMNFSLDARILIVGAGVTNTNMGRFLKKHGFTNFNVFNRTLSKAEFLAEELNGSFHPLSAIETFDKGFDIIITCTGSENHIISPAIYSNLLQGETDKKVVIDIAIPQDLDPRIVESQNINHISVEHLQKTSNENLKVRIEEVKYVETILQNAYVDFEKLYQERSIELALRSVPQKVKEIKAVAINEVFKNELNELDEPSRQVLEKVMGYMEKKYMSVPMKMAKEILLKK